MRVREAMTLMEERLGPGFVPGLARSAHLLADDADALEAWAQGAFDRWVHVTNDECGVDVEAIAGLPSPVAPQGGETLAALAEDAKNRDCLQILVDRWMPAAVRVWGRPGSPGELPLLQGRIKPRPAEEALAAFLADWEKTGQSIV